MLVQHLFKVVAIVLAGRAGGNAADEAVLEIDAHAELVAIVALAVLLGVGGIQVLLPALGSAPAGILALRQAFLVFLADVLAWCWHQRGIDGLPAPGHVAMALQVMLQSYNNALGALRNALGSTGTPAAVDYGDSFTAEDLPAIPQEDLPAGWPAWMGLTNEWAVRQGATAQEKRFKIQITSVP